MRYIFRNPQPPYRMGFDECVFLLIRYLLFVPLRENCLGRNAICPNAVWASLCGEVLREQLNACLCRGIWDR